MGFQANDGFVVGHGINLYLILENNQQKSCLANSGLVNLDRIDSLRYVGVEDQAQ